VSEQQELTAISLDLAEGSEVASVRVARNGDDGTPVLESAFTISTGATAESDGELFFTPAGTVLLEAGTWWAVFEVRSAAPDSSLEGEASVSFSAVESTPGTLCGDGVSGWATLKGLAVKFTAELSSPPAAKMDSSVDGTAVAAAYRGLSPNPTQLGTTFHFLLTSPGTVSVSIYDVRGRQVRHLEVRQPNPGEGTIEWDTRASDGGLVANGVYMVKIQAAGIDASARVLVAR
jgi:hypothetical protein